MFKTMKMVTLDTIGLTAFGYDFGCCEKLEYVGTFYVTLRETLRETLRAQSESPSGTRKHSKMGSNSFLYTN